MGMVWLDLGFLVFAVMVAAFFTYCALYADADNLNAMYSIIAGVASLGAVLLVVLLYLALLPIVR